MMARNFEQSVRLLAEGMVSFNDHWAVGIEPKRDRIAGLVGRSLMLVTALNPHSGCDKAASISKKAHKQDSRVSEAAPASGYVTGEPFDEWVVPEDRCAHLLSGPVDVAAVAARIASNTPAQAAASVLEARVAKLEAELADLRERVAGLSRQALRQ